MVICIVERRKKSIGYLLFLNAIMHSKVMHVHFFFFFFLPYLQDYGLLRSRNVATMAT